MKAPDMTPRRTCDQLDGLPEETGCDGLYIELGVTPGTLVEVCLLDLRGVEAARGSAEERLAGESPAGSQSSN